MTEAKFLDPCAPREKPISPDAIVSQRQNNLPGLAITTINEMIQANFNGRGASLKTDEILGRIGPILDESHGYAISWADVVNAYTRAGWSVLHFENNLIFTI